MLFYAPCGMTQQVHLGKGRLGFLLHCASVGNCQLNSDCWIFITGSTLSCRKNTKCLNKYGVDWVLAGGKTCKKTCLWYLARLHHPLLCQWKMSRMAWALLSSYVRTDRLHLGYGLDRTVLFIKIGAIKDRNGCHWKANDCQAKML